MIAYMGEASRGKWLRRIERAEAAGKSKGTEKTTRDVVIALVSLLIQQGWSLSGFPSSILGACVLWLIAALFIIHASWPYLTWGNQYKTGAAISSLLMIGAFVRPYVILQYAKEHPKPIDLSMLAPEANKNYMVEYGTSGGGHRIVVVKDKVVEGQPTSTVIANGDLLLQYAGRYKLVAVCFHMSGTDQFDDVTNISKSIPMNIRPGFVPIMITWNQEFIHQIGMGTKMTNYVLLLVPNHLLGNDFNSVNEAKIGGAYIL